MQRILTALAATLVYLLTGGAAFSQWEGTASLGLVVSTGNTETSTLAGRMDIKKMSGPWTNQILADLHRSKVAGVESTDRRLFGYKLSRELNRRCYVWGSLNFGTEPFARIDERKTAIFGYGYRVLVGPVHTLDFEAGAGYRSTKFVGAEPDAEDTPLRLSTAYTGHFNRNVKLSQNLSVEYSNENVLYASTTNLNIKMTHSLSMSIIYAVRHNSKIPGALGKMTDTLTTANLVYSF